MTQRWRWLAVVLLVPLLHVVPAGAAAPSTVRGVAGTWATISIRDQRIDWQLKQLASLTADRGPFVGFALVGSRTTLTYVNGRHTGRACEFADRCEVDDWPSVLVAGLGPQDADNHGFRLPAGAYRFVLLGAPGARVSLRSTLPFLSTPPRLTHRARVQLDELSSTTPPVGDVQPRADGAAAFEATGDAITGLQWRLDAQYVDSADASICIGSGGQSTPPQTGACEMGDMGVSQGSYVGYGTCPVTTPLFLCLPGTTDPVSVSHGVAAFVRGGSHTSYDLTVKAARSRIFGWAWNVRL